MTRTEDTADDPLAGIRVLDVTRAIAGPWATRILVDAGADVVKVEPPPTGDFVRHMPVVLGGGTSAYFAQANSGKRSIVLDLKDERCREIMSRLARESDVIVENLRPQAARRCGLVWEELQKYNPHAIFCAISGYGLDSPRAGKPGQDVALQCITGIAQLTGPPGQMPAFPTWSLSDTLSGTIAANAIIAALLARQKDGRGRFVDIRMDRCVMQLHDAGPTLLREHFPPDLAERFGCAHPSLIFRGIVRTNDHAYVAISAFRRPYWTRLANLLGPPFDTDAYSSSRYRAQAREEITDAITELGSKFGQDELLLQLRSARVPSEPLASLPDYILSGAHSSSAVEGVTIDGVPGFLGGAAVNTRRSSLNLQSRPPILGEHTIEVLRALGYSDGYIQDLFFGQVISFPLDQFVLLSSDERTEIERGT